MNTATFLIIAFACAAAIAVLCIAKKRISVLERVLEELRETVPMNFRKEEALERRIKAIEILGLFSILVAIASGTAMILGPFVL